MEINYDDKRTHRRYCFTAYHVFQYDVTKIVGLLFQLERCPSTGRLHYQGYMEFQDPVRYSGAVAALGGGVSVRHCRGSREDNLKYCSKSVSKVDGPWNPIPFPEKVPGQRNDIHDAMDVLASDGIRGVIEVAPEVFLKYEKSLRSMQLEMGWYKVRTWKTEVWWLCGESRTGKTEWCDKYFPREKVMDNFYTSCNQWWDGYVGQENVVIDDYRPEHFPEHLLLRLLDKTPLRVNIKGTTCQFLAKRIVINSNYRPQDIFSWEERIPLLNRIEHVLEFVRDPKGYVSVSEVCGNIIAHTLICKPQWEDVPRF